MVRILFLHPDLGIGGAERLVIDAALGLKKFGHEVSFLTNHHDPRHSFKETTDGSFPVQVVGDWLPRQICGRFYAFCAYLRILYAACYTTFFISRREKIDIIFCDLISACIPVLKLAKNRPRIIFYCHFPDQLLSREEGLLKRIYRAPINRLEEYTIGMADKTLVNSKFTLRVFQNTFRRLRIVPEVVYPSINTEEFEKMESKIFNDDKNQVHPKVPLNSFIFLDINRFERKKNHHLALYSFHLLGNLIPPNDFKRCRLIIAGGYDPRVVENVEYFEELETIAYQLNLEENVVLLRSPNDAEKFKLLYNANCLLYTPQNEHFGIVPLEGMFFCKPVIALNSGGPKETIVHSSTGFLCDDTETSFGGAMFQLFRDNALRNRMGDMGHKRVQQKFSFEAFASKLNEIVKEMMEQTTRMKKE